VDSTIILDKRKERICGQHYNLTSRCIYMEKLSTHLHCNCNCGKKNLCWFKVKISSTRKMKLLFNPVSCSAMVDFTAMWNTISICLSFARKIQRTLSYVWRC
jgi:hypothetical protein